MNEDTGSASYDEWHSHLDVNVGADEPWYHLVRKELGPDRDIADRRLLEIGCGRGGFALWLSEQSPPPNEVTAVDFSSVGIAKGREYATAAGFDGVNWQVGDIQAIPHPDAAFDTVISCETIEHVPEPQKAVRELARVLKPGGRLFLTAPNYFGPMGLYRAYLRLRGRRFTEVGQPINQLTLLPLTIAWIRRAGLRPETIRGEGHYLLAPGRAPRRISWLDRSFLKWLALHVLIVARKPSGP